MLKSAKLAMAKAVKWLSDIHAADQLNPEVNAFVNKLCGVLDGNIISDNAFSDLSASVKYFVPTLTVDGEQKLTWGRVGGVFVNACELAADKTHWANDKGKLKKLAVYAENIEQADSFDGTNVALTIQWTKVTPAKFMEYFITARNLKEFASSINIHSDALNGPHQKHAYSG